MKKRLTLRFTNILGLSTILLALLLTLGSKQANAQAGFTTLGFPGGYSQPLVICQDAIATSINSELTIFDPSPGLTENWSVLTSPSHGTLSLTGYVATSTGGNVTPSGWDYTPTSGYSGTDVFVIQIFNGTDTSTTTINVTVNPLPSVSAITGTFSECIGASTTLANATAGGTWFTSDASIATINTSGVVTGISAGSNTILYSVTDGATGCTNIAFATNTVLTVPVVAAIGGSSAVCVGSSITLTDATASGSWSSSASAVATVSSGGVVTGLIGGGVTISYSVTNSCGTGHATKPITVETSTVAPITPASAVSVCIGANTTLADATAGGTWGSVDPTIATVNPTTGVVTGVAVGTVTIVYTITNSCGTFNQTKSVTVTTIPGVPSSITGTASACIGASSTLSSSTSGGTWTSANTSIATVHPTTGAVTGVGAGTTTITYTVFNSCGSNFTTISFTTNTVPPTPAAITGPTSLCVGSTTTLSTSSSGGLWSSTNTSVASVNPTSGVVSGLSLGTTTISYTVTNTCGSSASFVTDTVTNVPVAPAAIGGATAVCVGSTILLTDATSGGAWSTSNASVASITTAGVVRGISTGSVVISYTVTNFCGVSAATSTIIVNDVPAAPGTPSGVATLCVGSSSTFTDGTSGGSWSSSNTAVATVHPTTGLVTALTTGTINISYTVTNSCGSTSSATSLTVNTVPSVPAIGGTLAMCTGATTNLTNTTSGGVWVSGSPSIATIDPSSGLVTSFSTAGSSIITYTVTNGCGSTSRNATVTVTAPPATPAAIAGATQVCVGSNTTLTDATSGGTWSSSATTIATVSNAGVVTGLLIGSAVITYTSSNFCGAAFVTHNIDVLSVPTPAAIIGAATVCVGAATTLTDATTGGVWSSTNTAIATINNTTTPGEVTGVAVGSVTISYNVTNICGTGFRVKALTVNNVPTVPAIVGASSVCVGSTVGQSNSTAGGVWASSNPAVASVNPANGNTFGTSAGTVTISYTVTNTCGSTTVTKSFTTTTVPALGAISGTSPMCAGTTATFTDTTGGGTWTTGNASIASVVSGTGFVTAVGVGTVNISYTKSNSCGSSTTTSSLTVITVPGLPSAITGANSVCVADSIQLADVTAGGTWISGNTAVATVSSTGFVVGVTGGSVTISYQVSNSCGTSAPRTKVITVNTRPTVAAIGGTTTRCIGATTTLTDATGGGVWATSDASIASINSGSGLVTPVAVGTATISYTVTNGCGPTTVTRTFTVITVPATPPAITGTTSVCVGSSTTLADSVTGGAWTTSNVAIASVNSASGVVTGVSGGTANITYTLTNTCGSTAINTAVTVNTVPASPAAITGATQVCASDTTTFADATAGGVWSSSLPGVATVNASTGLITGITAGSAATISYTVSNGCGPTTVTKAISVITVPAVAAIGGGTTVCVGSTTTLTDATSGGVWSTSDASIASVNGSGVVTGVSGSPTGLTAVISYAVTNACGTTSATRTVTVLTTPAAPASIAGTTTICLGTSTTLTDATSGGVWSSTNTGVATVSTTGSVFGSSVGTATISYTVSNTCGPTAATTTFNVITAPVVPAITGPSLECVGSSITMSNSTPGGTWVSSNPSVATVSTTGVVTGASVGTTVIIYSVTNICGTNIATKNDTVINGTVAAITGASNVCRGSSITLSSATTGGTWSSSNFTIATVVPSTGVVTGVAQGSATITYSVTTACGTNSSTQSVTVDTSGVAAITGSTTVCETATTTLADVTPGGVWSTLDPTIATVNPSTGVVTGILAGSATIRYTVVNSCGTFQRFIGITVNPLPVPGTITGGSVVCVASTITLSDPAAGGTWSTTDASVATVNTTGDVTGVSAGTATISYSVSNSCGTLAATASITVNPLPNAGTISGATDVCETSTITLSASVTGGSWNSGAPGVAGVDAAGVVTGLSAGTAIISYSVTNSCGTDVATHSVDVHALPVVAGITGSSVVCEAATTTLSNATAGGTWSTASASTASIDASTGLVYGVAAGATTISYTVVSSFSCTTAVTASITVNPLPISGTITGPTAVCEGSSITLADAATGGSWSTGVSGNANVGGTGVVNGLVPGTDTVFYTVTNSCGTSVAFYPITINPLPHAGVVSGIRSVVCEADTIELSSSLTGGSWSSVSVGIATVSTTGVVTGVAAGTTNIQYSITNGCGTDVANYPVTVNPLPVAGTISGSSTVCATAFTTLTESATGGTWSTSATGNATVNTFGVVTGITAGPDTVYYVVTNSCGTATAIHPMTVLPQPVAGSILGGNTVCVAALLTLTDTAAGSTGTWSSSLPGVASVQSPGVILGVSAGLATISYAVTNSCGTAVATHAVTVNPLPAAGTITGTNVVCVGSTVALSNTTSSATTTSYSSSDTSIAKVNATTGIVTGISSGLAIISYTATNSCGTAFDTMMVRVNPLPDGGTITGTPVVCVNSTITLTTVGSVGSGSWSSTNTTIATVNAASGVVRGRVAGTDTIRYIATNSCGADTSFVTLTVNPLPDAGTITGLSAVCATDSITLTDTSGGGAGTWTVSPGSIAITGASAGVIIGVSAGTAHVTYSVTNSCGTDTVQHTVTVNPLPNATIAGPSTVCVSGTITLTHPGSVGTTTWSASNGNATIAPVTGVVNGVAGGLDTIRIVASTATCGTDTATSVITVIALPLAGTIYGPASVCVGSAVTLGDTTATVAGTWTTSAPGIASVNPSGDVSGISAGSATITYTVTTSCGTARATFAITVIGVPTVGSIGGSSPICEGSTAVFTNTVVGGRWSSSSAAVATIDTASGLASALSAGTTTISYTKTNACASVSATFALTVNPLPVAGVITPGTYSLCQYDSTTLTDTVTGGTWSTVSAGIASVSTTGVVYGMSGGTTVINYCKTNSCGTICAGATITVNRAPNAGAITGSSTVCETATTTLSSPTGATGGTWSSSASGTAAVGASTGIVSGVAAGTVTITYIDATASCGSDTATWAMTVLPRPIAGVISGPSSVCTGSTISLSVSGAGGTGSWTSSTTAASVDGAGTVLGLSGGSTVISYTYTNSCGSDYATHAVTVNLTPVAGAIVGPTTVCVGSTVALTNPTGSSGTWSSAVTSLADFITTTGVLTGISSTGAGTVTISYTASSASCGTVYATRAETVSPAPDAGTISGPSTVCRLANITLTTTGSGGSWSSASVTTASVDPTAGIVYGRAVGTVNISYSVTNSCGTATSFYPVTVLVLPYAGTLSGPASVCEGATVAFTSTGFVGSPSWTSSDATIAAVDGFGTVTGVAGGYSASSATITYTVTNSCGTDFTTRGITVNPRPIPGTISGPTNVCMSSSITLSIGGASGTGTWSGGSGHASVGSTTGVVTGTSAGTAIITYSVTNSCGTEIATYSVTVDPSAVAGTITGSTDLCLSGALSTITMGISGSVGTGSWSTATSSVVTIDASGTVYAVAAGSTTITYTATTVCSSSYTIATVTVHPMPDAGTLSGYTAPFCAGTTITMSSTTSGGSWSVTPFAVAGIGSTSGIVTGAGGGTATVTYTVTSAYCGSDIATTTISVLPLPSVGGIGAPSNICVGSSTSINVGPPGGTWSISTPSIASVNFSSATASTSFATLYGVSAGTAIISYAVTNSCGTTYSTATVNVHAVPTGGTISGPSLVCTGSSATYTLSTAATGGTSAWSASAGGSITSGGVFTAGATPATVTITYLTTSTYCGTAFDTALVSVVAPPVASVIVGNDTICEGTTTLLTDSVSGGTWTTSNASIASVTATGTVIGIATGNVIIRYTLTNPCGTDIRSFPMYISPSPHAGVISGTSSLCVGTPVTLTASIPGGTWSATNSIATVSSSGSVLGSTVAGNDTILYVVTNSCGSDTSMKVVTVNLLPDAGHITGSQFFICGGDSITLFNTQTGGYWTSSNAAVGPITTITTSTSPSQAKVYGVSAGITVIAYNFTNYCGTARDTVVITVRPVGHCYDEVDMTAKATEVGIYPNPAVATLHIDAPVKVNVSVISPDGKVVIEQRGVTDIDVSNLANGLYMIMIYDETNALLKASKFIKAQ